MRNGWSSPTLEIDRTSVVPIYRQIVDRLREQILSGALPGGTRLPPERSLAATLAVNRSTIVHAYRDLAVAGLIDQRVGSGSRVAALEGGHPERSVPAPWWATVPPWRTGQTPALLAWPAPRAGRIALVGGVPPADPSPLGALARSFAGVGGDADIVLACGASEGYRPLREAIAARMLLRGAKIDARDVLVLTGSTQGLALVAQTLAEPGDEIVVEAPAGRGALQVFAVHGLRALDVPVDEDGLRVDALEAVLRARRPRFIYSMPSLHDPTGVTMSEERRERLVMLAARFGVPVVEDDPCGELAPPRSTPLVARDPGLVIYVSSFSQTIAPSLRLGWLCAPRTIHERILLRKQASDRATSLFVQAGVREFLRSAFDSHLPRLRAELQTRRDIARAAIDAYWPATVQVSPGGGYYLWATTPREQPARRLLAAAEQLGASALAGETFFTRKGGEHNLRLALTPVSRDALTEGVRRIGEAFAR